jgi:adenine-specific DNA-methyltransferase
LARMAKKKDENVEAYRHETGKRKIVVSAGLASYDTSKPKPKRYDYDPHLLPQLIWSGKKENASFEVPKISLYIHESQLWCLTPQIWAQKAIMRDNS